MIRRLHVDRVRVGNLRISDAQAHHARNVLRLQAGTKVEVFDDAGNLARGTIEQVDPHLIVKIDAIESRKTEPMLTIASAIPKGERADWMIEKLSELGVSRFVPLITERSIVQASGKNKLERWRRIATESAKQSRRAGVMQIDEPTPLETAIKSLALMFVLSMANDAISITRVPMSDSIALFIGPEGGWTDAEAAQFRARKIEAIRLTNTILRTETAAIAVAAIVASSFREDS